MSSKKKIVKPAGLTVTPKKPVLPNLSSSYYGESPCWRFSKIWIEPESNPYKFYGHREFSKHADYLISKLKLHESRKWSEISIESKKQSHSIPVEDIAKEARQIIQQIEPGLEKVYSLRLSGTERVWGKVDDRGVMWILLWDPNHKVYPQSK